MEITRMTVQITMPASLSEHVKANADKLASTIERALKKTLFSCTGISARLQFEGEDLNGDPAGTDNQNTNN